MDVTNRNVKTFIDGIRKAKIAIEYAVIERLKRAAEELIVDAEFAQGYQNLTGNTLTSYAIGIYYKGELREFIDIFEVDEGIDKPTRPKLSTGKGWITIERYGGGKAHVLQDTLEKTDGDYGYNTSRRLLEYYTPKTDGFELVMCTGTEYSEYLEDRGLNVLTETFMLSPRVFLNNLKRIRL